MIQKIVNFYINDILQKLFYSKTITSNTRLRYVKNNTNFNKHTLETKLIHSLPIKLV
jgi:hypothetical protein